MLRVTRDGQITVLRAFGNIVPTGLEVRGRTIYMAEAGPIPHLPEAGKVVAFRPLSTTVREVASGSPLLADVEFGRRGRLYALSQGIFGVALRVLLRCRTPAPWSRSTGTATSPSSPTA